jgi:predicted DNA-binding protein (MmcQ/YjbR family)
VTLHGDVPGKMVCELITHSYNLIFESLPKKEQAEITELEN